MAAGHAGQPIQGVPLLGTESFVTTRLDAVLGWARQSWILASPFGGSCCGIELAAASGPRYDLERHGVPLPCHAPAEADLLIAAGSVTHPLVPMLEDAFASMPEPRWVMAFGACACSGGPYQNYAVAGSLDQFLPVDVYVPGCPPRPEALIDAVLKLKRRIGAEPVGREGRGRAAPLDAKA